MEFSASERERAAEQVAAGFVGRKVSEALEPIAIMEIAVNLQCELNRAVELLRDSHDSDPCSYDHHGYCQNHGQSSRPCINERLCDFLAHYPEGAKQ